MRVWDWIQAHPGLAVTITQGAALEQAMDRMLSQACVRDLYIVTETGSIAGHLSHKKLAHLLLAEHRPVHTRRQLMEQVASETVDELMDTDFVFAQPDEELDNVRHRQLEHEIEDMPVIDTRAPCWGVINLSAVLREMRREGELGTLYYLLSGGILYCA